MTEEIKDLIEKIQQEGIQAAQDKAKEIEAFARRQAEEIVKKAKAEAEKLISEAKEQIAKREENTRILLQQAGRDVLLGLRKEINAMLERLVISGIRQALTAEELTKILTTLIKNYHGKENIIVLLKEEDLEKLEKAFLEALKEETKKGIALHPAEDIQAGFIISYDNGKSYYDFTDEALAEYIGSYLKPKLKEILK